MLPVNGLTADEAYQLTLDKKGYLEQQGYEVIEKWECQLLKELRQDPEMKAFFDAQQMQEPLNPRNGFFGGRTNAVKLYHKVAEGEKIGYVDICSLYPWVCKYGKFPLGHPNIITENFKKVSANSQPYEGMITCKILAPKGLLHPVLPYRTKDKLMFPLCKACADQENQGQCNHTEEERSFWGTWVTEEVYKALELDYKLLDIAEVWHYDEIAQYDGTNPETGLFTQYINTFLKLKQEKSDWPKWVLNAEDVEAAKMEYICQYEEKEGIKLDPAEIEKNEAMRQLAKLMLNSFWGKFGQRANLGKTEYFQQPDEFFRCVFNPTNEVSSIHFCGDKLAYVTYTKDEDFIDSQVSFYYFLRKHL